jgi:hypothetical protein
MGSAAAPSAEAMARGPQSVIADYGWMLLPGSARDVTASPDGTIYAVSNLFGGAYGNAIFHYVNGSWNLLPGAATRIAVGPDGTLWALDANGIIYSYRKGSWTTFAAGVSDLSIGADNSVYVISTTALSGADKAIFRYAGGQWTQFGGAGVTIAASWDTGTYPNIRPGGFYVTTSLGTIYYY